MSRLVSGVVCGLALMVGCGDRPGPLQVGVGHARMPAPVGIGTVGFGGVGVEGEPSPFAEIYPATTRMHNHPDFRAIAVSRGEGHEVVLLRSDTVGIFQQLRRAVIEELESRLGRDLDNVLVIGATHTHSGPGRVIDVGGPFALIADEFLAEHHDRMVDAMADAVEEALSDLAPGRIGWTFGRDDLSISDRRCEDGGADYVNGEIPILAIEQEGELRAIAMTYPIHGTLLGIEELTLSQDVSGAIEQAVEDRFERDVQVQMFNSWGADVAPGDPDVEEGEGAEQPSGYDRMERVGSAVADAVEIALSEITWEEEPELWLATHREPIDRASIGYGPDEFEYEYGAVYCGGGTDRDCDASTREDTLDESCVPFPEDYPAPKQTEISAGQIGRVHLITFPGEPGTVLGEQVVGDIQAEYGVEDVLFMGYAQDYLGYAILEEDWWQGGYEAGGALWGPRQGEYLATRAVAVYGRAIGELPEIDEPAPVTSFLGSVYEPYAGPSPVALGTVIAPIAPEAPTATDVMTWTVAGDDPWYGTPVVTLETELGEPVLRPNGTPWTSDGQAFWVSLAVDPPYEFNDTAETRQFAWTFSMPVQHRVASAGPDLIAGEGYRMVAALPTASGEVREVKSAVFPAP